MFKRLIKVIVSITATAAIIIVLLIVVAIVGQRYRFESTPSVDNIDIYTLHSDSREVIQCRRDSSGFAVLTDHNGEVLSLQPVSSEAELKKCIEAFESGILPFDPRNYIGRYEAGYVSWEGFDHENIYHWGVLDECVPHYQFKEKSHPWIVDTLSLVDTIEVTFTWTGTDAEWDTCFVAREKQTAEIDLSEIEVISAGSILN